VIRATCDNCAKSKVRCSKEQPRCQRCIYQGVRCVYGLSQRSKKRRQSNDSSIDNRPNDRKSLPAHSMEATEREQTTKTLSRQEEGSTEKAGLFTAMLSGKDSNSITPDFFSIDHSNSQVFAPISLLDPVTEEDSMLPFPLGMQENIRDHSWLPTETLNISIDSCGSPQSTRFMLPENQGTTPSSASCNDARPAESESAAAATGHNCTLVALSTLLSVGVPESPDLL
jgi:hypothetical protein